MWSTVKRFGLQHCDLPTMIWNVAVMLRALALIIDIRDKRPISILIYILGTAIALAYFYVYLVSMIWFVFVRCRQTGDLLTALIILPLGISSEIGTVKLVCLFMNIGKIRQMVGDILAIDATVNTGSRFSNNLMITLREVKKRAIIFWAVIIGNGTLYFLKPILMPGRHFMEDKFILLGLEPMLETPNYQIAFSLLTCGIIFTCYPSANISVLLIIITGYIEAQMLALAQELTNLWNDANENYDKSQATNVPSAEANNTIQEYKIQQKIKNKIINEYVNKRLKNIIQNHANNLHLLLKVEQVFNVAIGLEFFILGLGLIVELLGGLENTWIEMPFAMIQVGMDCFTGQRLMDASMKFEKAVYECKWENYDRSNMKTIQIMLQCSQKAMKLSAGGIAVLSFSCLMQVSKSIYSAFTTLRQTMK